MQFPVAPAALLFALAPTLALPAMCYWRFKTNGGISPFQIAAPGVGVGLAALVIAVGSTYAFRTFFPARASNWLIAVPLIFHVGILVVAAVKTRIEVPSLVIWGFVGLAPLYFVGFYAWLLAACSFGDCL